MLCAFAAAVWVLSLCRLGMAPIINDVATDLNHAPMFVDNAKLGPLPQAYKKQIYDFEPYRQELRPLKVQGPLSSVYEACLKSCSRMPRWRLSTQDSAKGVIEGVAVTALLRFKDDFVIRLEEQAGSTRVDMCASPPSTASRDVSSFQTLLLHPRKRVAGASVFAMHSSNMNLRSQAHFSAWDVPRRRSKSRLGKGDLGANAKRIQTFLQDVHDTSGMQCEWLSLDAPSGH